MPQDLYEKWFREERTNYQESYDSSQKRLDEILLIVTIPALGWFIVCLKDIGYPFNTITCWLVWLIIGGFTSVIILNALSLWASFISAFKMIQNLDVDYITRNDYAMSEDKHKFWRWWYLTKILNYMAYICFITACISLASFVILSINLKIEKQKINNMEVIEMERKGNIPLPPSPKPPTKEIQK